ncbi:MAG: hypothetical protein LBG91_03865 [Treponema sp.]|nr:hypothetical protein [Treponema sp.]
MITALIGYALFFAGCDLQPDSGNQAAADGILLYSGREILNGKKWEIVTNRVQQLRAVSLSGHQIEWSTNNSSAVDVTQTGLIRAGRTPNKEAVITVTSIQDPSIRAEVIFRTKGLR